MLIITYFFFSSLFVSLFDLNVSDLEVYENKIIQVRGFWYPIDDTCGILSSQPHVKSCCVSSLLEQGKQLVIQGNSRQFIIGQPLTIQGIVKIVEKQNRQGEKIRFLQLEQPTLVSYSQAIFWFFLATFFLLLSILYKKFRLRMSASNK